MAGIVNMLSKMSSYVVDSTTEKCADSKTEKDAVDPTIEKCVVDSTTEKSEVHSKVEKCAVDSTTEKSEVRSKVKKSAVDSTTEKSEVRSKVKKSVVDSTTEKSEVDSTIVKSWREYPPSSYSLKINKLSQHTLDKYESRHFMSGGYNWRLVIYPNGNEKDNGSGFISMYVEFDDSCLSSTSPIEVLAYLMFFVYNKKERRYFSIQDVEVKPFNALKTVWGLSQVLSVDTFTDPENGYIFDGEQCEFGVDVMIASPLSKWEVISFDEKLSLPKFSWSIKDFSILEDKSYHRSDSFVMGGRKWFLQLHPKGDNRTNGKSLAIYLFLDESEILKVDEKIYVRAPLKVINPDGSKNVTHTVNKWFKETKKGYGFAQFMSLTKLQEKYVDLEEDTLNVEIKFEVLSVTKHST